MEKKLTKKQLLNAIDKRYKVSGFMLGGYNIFDKEVPGKRTQYQFIGNFTIKKGHYIFNDTEYTDSEELIKAMREYNNTQPFSPDINNPTLLESYRILCALEEYLTSVGFVAGDSYSRQTEYNLLDMYGDVLCSITIEMNNEDSTDTSGTIIRYKSNGSWTESPFYDLKSAIAACNTLLATYVSTSLLIMLNTIKKLTTSRCSELLYKTYNIRTLSVITEDAKKQCIELIEKELTKLKEENDTERSTGENKEGCEGKAAAIEPRN